MPTKSQQTDLFAGQPLEFELNGVVLPDDHSVYKLFPGKTYRLANVMRESSFAFLDIHGLDRLAGQPAEWSDDDLLRTISLDRVLRSGTAKAPGKRRRRGSEQDKKRLGFLKNLFFVAKKGDLVVVPLGEGYSGQIAIGELIDDAGVVRKLTYTANEEITSTFGRRVRWVNTVARYRFSAELTKSLHSPTAFHPVGFSNHEEIYVQAYGTFAYKNIFVAKFPTRKEIFNAQDYANIGVIFNGLSVVHDHILANDLDKDAPFYDLAIEEDGSATIELTRNSPLSVVVRTVGPLAFSAAIMFSAAAEGRPLKDLRNITVTARQVGSATDRCPIEIPPDTSALATGLGVSRFKTYCSAQKKLEQEANVKSPARLKTGGRKAK